MRQILIMLGEWRENISFWGQTRVASWVISNWNTIGWFTLIFTIILITLNTIGICWLGYTIYNKPYQNYNQQLQDLLLYISFFLTIFFGLVTLLSLFVAVAVLNSLREIIPDYSQASLGIEKIIKKARNEILILSINPSFLQVLDPQGLRKWQGALVQKLNIMPNLKVKIAYVERGRLVRDKFPLWAGNIGVDARDLSDKFLNTYLFSIVRNKDYIKNFNLIPLNTNDIPFVIAIADDDMAMFCHSIIYPKIIGVGERDVRTSVIKGVISYDQNIVQAIKEIYYQTVKLNAGAYKYECNQCKRVKYLYDHQIIVYDGEFTVETLSECPPLSCQKVNQCDCNGELRFQGNNANKLTQIQDDEIRDFLYQKISEGSWD